MKKKITVILLDNVSWLWNKWTLVDVAPAYAKNALISRWLAKIADKNIIDKINFDINKKEEKKNSDLEKFDKLIEDADKWLFKILRTVAPWWKLYDKVDAKVISLEILEKYKFNLPKDSIKLSWKIDQEWETIIDVNFLWKKDKLKVLIAQK